MQKRFLKIYITRSIFLSPSFPFQIYSSDYDIRGLNAISNEFKLGFNDIKYCKIKVALINMLKEDK